MVRDKFGYQIYKGWTWTLYRFPLDVLLNDAKKIHGFRWVENSDVDSGINKSAGCEICDVNRFEIIWYYSSRIVGDNNNNPRIEFRDSKLMTMS